jgi:hypothetical protein
MDVFDDTVTLSSLAKLLPIAELAAEARQEVPIFATQASGVTQQSIRTTRSVRIQQPAEEIISVSKDDASIISETIRHLSEIEALKKTVKQQQEVCEVLYPYKVGIVYPYNSCT